MPSLIDIRRRVRSTRNARQIAKAMKMIAAAKLRGAQERAAAEDAYGKVIKKSLAKVSVPAARRGAAPSSLKLGDLLRRNLTWTPTEDLALPWKSQLAKSGHSLAIRLNDFPDEPMYTVLVGKKEIGSFDDWPSNWRRGGDVVPGETSLLTSPPASKSVKRVRAAILKKIESLPGARQ